MIAYAPTTEYPESSERDSAAARAESPDAIDPVGKREHAVLYLAALVVSLIVWWPTLFTFFVYDDYNLLYWAIARRPPYLADWLPIEVGFWRPFAFMSARAMYAIGGLNPLPYHLLAVALHAGVAVATARLGRALGLSRWAARAAAALFLLHPATYNTVAMFQNIADLYFALFALLGLELFLAILRAPRTDGRRATLLLFVCFLVLATKETALAYLGPLVIFAVGFGAPARFRDRRLIALLASLALLFVVIAAWSYRRQHGAEFTYVGSGLVAFSHDTRRRFLDYAFTLFWPHAFAAPNAVFGAPEGIAASRLIRAGTMLGVTILLIVTWLRDDLRSEAVLLTSALCLLVLPSLVYYADFSRYVYAALPLWALAMTGLVQMVPSARAKAGLFIGALLLFAPGLRVTDSRGSLLLHAEEMRALSLELDSHVIDLPAGGGVFMYNHPYGRNDHMWPYGQFWLWTRYPDKHFSFDTMILPAGEGHPQIITNWNGLTVHVFGITDPPPDG